MNTFELLAIVFLRASAAFWINAAMIYIVARITGGKPEPLIKSLDFTLINSIKCSYVVISFYALFIKVGQ